jgi:POT family proton-dependent oligopeptide transporter
MLLGHVALGISGLEGGVGPTFYTGLVLVAAGNGLFKPNISVLVGRLPYASPGARDAAFGTFWMFINIGGLVAIVLGGLVAERFGWHSAFGIAAFGMAVAISLMWVFGARYIAPYVTPPQGAGSGHAEVDGGFVAPFAVVFVVVAIFGVAYYQIFGALSLFTAKHIDRELFGLQIPTIWIVSLNPVFMLILMPIVSKNWSDGRGLAHAWSTTGKMALGFVLLALAFAVILGAVVSAGDNLASPLWIVAAVFLLTCAELMTGPIALAAVSRLAPAPIANLAMGGFSAAVGIGALLSGQVGALTVDYGIGFVFSVIIVGAILTAGILFLSRRWLARLDI